MYTIIVCVAVFYQALVQCKATHAPQQYRYNRVSSGLPLGVICLNWGPGHQGGAKPCAEATAAKAATATATGIQLHLQPNTKYSYS